jgi:nucleotide-binding universal stress UspA family protein
MKVIAAMNGLVSSDVAALYALRYAALFDYTLCLLHVLNPSDRREEVELSMTIAEEAALHYRVKTERVFLTGEPVEAIRKYLAATRTDTLFCSTRMRAQKRFFQNSLSEKLSRLPLPVNLAVVRVVHVNAVFVTENILLPIREDRLSVRKFAFFSSLAKAFGAATEIYSIHPTGRDRLAAMDTHTARMLFQKINTSLSHYANTMKLLDIPLAIKHALTSREVDQILHHLSRHDFQLMIIGGRRPSAFPEFFRENPMERLFRHTSVNTIAFYAREGK